MSNAMRVVVDEIAPHSLSPLTSATLPLYADFRQPCQEEFQEFIKCFTKDKSLCYSQFRELVLCIQQSK